MNILAVGQGSVLLACAKILRARGAYFSVIEPRETFPFSSIVPHMAALNVPIFTLSTEELIEYINLAHKPLVIFSIANRVLFPPNITEREDITIVNYHNAILPGHRGRNCEAWQIYNQEKYAGVSWHYVDAGVDTGAVICQSVIPLLPNVTSIRLLAMQGREAVRLFSEVHRSLLPGGKGNVERKKETNTALSPLHYSWERPNGGKLDPTWPMDKIWAFLRAMDYGALYTLGIPSILWDGTWYTWRRYTKEGMWNEDEKTKVRKTGSTITFFVPTGNILLKGCLPLE